jgi:prophage antirepressor-like protein
LTETLTTLFEGKEIHAFERDGDIWIPVADVAAVWGVDRTTPNHIILRNPEVFEGTVIGGDVTSHYGPCVSERGLYMLMGKISAARLKNPYAKATVIRFQRWVPELIQKYRKGEIRQQPTDPMEQLKTEIACARMIAQETGGNLVACQKIALERCGYGDYAPALDITPFFRHGEKGWYNPSELVALCQDPDLTPERLNHYLHNNPRDPKHPYQIRDENHLWRLTEEGMKHGREIEYTGRGGHTEPRIEWRGSSLYASGLKREIPESQSTLTPARA